MERVLKRSEDLELGTCDVVYVEGGRERIYKNAKVCDVETKSGIVRVVYFIIPVYAKIVGYIQD